MRDGFIEKKASEASERSGQPERVLTWHTSCAMLPLVDRIAQDIASHHGRLAELRPELQQLENERRHLSWPQRSRRYQLEEDIASTEASLKFAVAELEGL